MIQEAYCSYEVSKLLKEKGFDIYVPSFYDVLGEFNRKVAYWNWNAGPRYSAPTLQMTMKWLREVHNLVIEPYRTACGYLYTISNIPYGSTKYDNSQAFNGDDEDSGQWTTWERACEDGIKYCLENLI